MNLRRLATVMRLAAWVLLFLGSTIVAVEMLLYSPHITDYREAASIAVWIGMSILSAGFLLRMFLDWQKR